MRGDKFLIFVEACMFRPLFPVLFAALVMSACSNGPRLVTTPNVTVAKDVCLPAPLRENVSAPARDAYLGPLDTIVVNTFGVEDLSKELVIDAGGNLSFPLIGQIDVNGRTTNEVARTIEQGLRGRYVRRPQVSVTIKEQVSQFVTVDGSVERPGQYPVTNNSTLMRAVALGGGLSEFGKIDDVVILRTVGAKRMAGLYNLGQIRRGVYDDPVIFPNDVIVVGESSSRRLFRNALAVAPLFVAPLVAVIQ